MKKEQLETKNISDHIPELNTTVRIYPFDDSHVLVECNDHQLKIKKQFELLINLIDGKNNISQICQKYLLTTKQAISDVVVYNLFYTDLAAYGVVKSDSPVKVKKREIHLRLSFIFWKGNSLTAVSKILSPLFKPFFFYSSLILMFLFSIFVLCFCRSEENNLLFSYSNISIYASCSFLILMLHELGHVAACNKFSAAHKGIGFGFYLFSPVFFADVSDAWKLTQKQRMIVNLGGIYIEFIIVTGLFISFLLTNNAILFYVGIAILIHIWMNINPFLKYDGYWLLSDITNTTNLRSKSVNKLKNVLRISRLKQFLFKDYLLVLYALASYISIGFFLFFIFYYDSDAVLNLPAKLFKFLITFQSNIHTSIPEILERIFRNIIPALFYLFLFRFIYRLINSLIQKFRVNEK